MTSEPGGKDIVETLREMAGDNTHQPLRYDKDKRTYLAAATEIERLRAELEAAREGQAKALAEAELMRREVATLMGLLSESGEIIRRASGVIEACNAAGFLDGAGNVRKVLGKLPLTADGCVIGMGAVCHSGIIPGFVETTHRNTLWVNEEKEGEAPRCGIVVNARPGLGWWSTKELAAACYTVHSKLRDEITAEAARTAAESAKGGAA